MWFWRKNSDNNNTETKLDQTLIEAKTNPEQRVKFYRLLLESDIYIPVKLPQPLKDPLKGGEVRPVSNTNIEHVVLAAIQDKDAHTVFPVFSSLEKLKAYMKQPTTYFVGKGREIFEVILQQSGLQDTTIVGLNPGIKASKGLTLTEIKGLLSGKVFDPSSSTYPAGTKMTIGVPNNKQDELVNYLGKFFEGQPDVEAAYLVLVGMNAENQLRYMIGIKSHTNIDRIMPEIKMITAEYFKADDIAQFIDCMNFNGLNQQIKNHMTSSVQPFYQK